MEPVSISLPNWPYDSLDLILFAEAAAAFEELTLSHGVDQLTAQVPDAWPNNFRQARFLAQSRRRIEEYPGVFCRLRGSDVSLRYAKIQSALRVEE